MILYNRSFEHDALMLKWYQELLQTGDFDVTFMPSAKPLSRWLGIFRSCQLVFDCDEAGIWWAGWFEPTFGGAMYAMWCRKDKRHTIANTAHTLLALESGLVNWPVIFSLTIQPHLIEAQSRLGYNVVGEVPGLWEERSAWLLVLTRNNFEQGAFYGWWRKKREQQRDRLSRSVCAGAV